MTLWVVAVLGWVLFAGTFAVLCLVSSAAVRRQAELEDALRAAQTGTTWTVTGNPTVLPFTTLGPSVKPPGWFGNHES